MNKFCALNKKCPDTDSSVANSLGLGDKNLPFKMITIGVIGDGSCLYHSIAYSLNIENYKQSPYRVRKNLVKNMRSFISNTIQKKTWHQFWIGLLGKREYLKLMSIGAIPSHKSIKTKMKQTSVWGDFFQIIYIMRKIFNVNILFVDDKNRSLYCGTDNFKQSKYSIIIQWVRKGSYAHFQPVEVHDKRTEESATKIRNDSNLMKLIYSKYKRVCGKDSLKDSILKQGYAYEK